MNSPWWPGLATLALLGGCGDQDVAAPEASAAEQKHVAITTEELEPYECGSITRLHTLGGVFLASQPSRADLEQAKKGGVVSVIDLRHPEEDRGFVEAEVVAELGLTYHNPAWNGPEELTDEVFERVLALLRTVERPVLFHCSSANRVGAVWIPYRVLEDELELEAAVAEARTVGLRSPAYEQRAREYVLARDAGTP